MSKCYPFLLCILLSAAAHAQTNTISTLPPAKQHQILLQRASYAPLSQFKGTSSGPVFDTTRWQHWVDSVWGTGIPDANKLSVLNTIWASIDSTYSCFVHLPMYNWDSLINAMRTEVNAGVSRGRFAAMLNHLRRYINDGHSVMYDLAVDYPTTVFPGMPLMRGESGRFGACITMLPDSTAMVYDAEPGHPFGLQPGDIVLGYNGMAWKDLVQIMLRHELPSSVYPGSTDIATYQRMIKGVGENWYLFDTINIKKCNGSLVNFPTSYMANTFYSSMCTDQMPVPGVHKLSFTEYYYQNKSISYGLISGTKIGYVYMMDCEDGTGNALYNAVKHLVEDSAAQSLIFDIRTNFGGSFNAYIKTFEYLTDLNNTPWVGYGERVSVTDRYMMFNQPSFWYNVLDTDASSFYKPVAVLVGPEAVSAGDFFQVLFRRHPWARVFGRSTAGAYGSYHPIATGQADYYASKQDVNFYDVADPTFYLSHTEYPVDQQVWLTKDSTCAGIDNVVSEAVKWINGELSVPTVNARAVGIKVYPNPANGDVHILFSSPSADQYTIRLCNIMGSVILQQSASAATGKIDLYCGDLPDGTYFLTVQNSNSYRVVQKISIVH
ncbi:MAG: T9SS type A sorting domain-containing protein [Bacteroidetes bacterium]|nr:T9SS type A sorting domain-containing protein [Bacteroidota bacterium]